uniref:Protein unc-93 homolog A n=1 Tax=Ciona savignyi TaxID=51511 RepID=H2ZG98_CIOSA
MDAIGDSEDALSSGNDKGHIENDVIHGRVTRYLYILGITVMFIYGAYIGVIGLESSMNIEEGLGTTSVMVVFVVSFLSCLTFVPFVIDFYGAKFAIIIGELGFVIYIAANLYPSWYTLIPAAILHGITESCPWAGSSFYVTFLGHSKSKKSKSLKKKLNVPQEAYVYKFFGLFYSMIFAGEIIGSSITAAVLLGFQGHSNIINEQNITGQTEGYSTTIMSPTRAYHEEVTTESITGGIYNPLARCGSQDCQEEYIYDSSETNLEKFNPSKISIYVLLSVFLVISIGFICIQALFLPRAPAKYDKLEESDEAKNFIQAENENVLSGWQSTLAQFWYNTKSQLKLVYQHVISPLHLCFMLFPFYYGLVYAYNLTEYTRAFVSCTIGVEKMGVAMVVLGGCSVVGSLIGTFIIPRIGRKKCLVLLTLWHFGSYLLNYFWSPNPHNTWAVYLIGAVNGIGSGFLMTILDGFVAVYFEDRLGIAFSVKSCITNLGIVAATGWSTRLCVYVKLYLQIGFLFISVLSISIAERLYNRKRKHKSKIVLQEQTNTLSL